MSGKKWRLRESISGGEYERRDGHKPHYSLDILVPEGADIPPADPRGKMQCVLVEGGRVTEETVVHWSYYAFNPEHWQDREHEWEFDTYDDARRFALERGSRATVTPSCLNWRRSSYGRQSGLARTSRMETR